MCDEHLLEERSTDSARIVLGFSMVRMTLESWCFNEKWLKIQLQPYRNSSTCTFAPRTRHTNSSRTAPCNHLVCTMTPVPLSAFGSRQPFSGQLSSVSCFSLKLRCVSVCVCLCLSSCIVSLSVSLSGLCHQLACLPAYLLPGVLLVCSTALPARMPPTLVVVFTCLFASLLGCQQVHFHSQCRVRDACSTRPPQTHHGSRSLASGRPLRRAPTKAPTDHI